MYTVRPSRMYRNKQRFCRRHEYLSHGICVHCGKPRRRRSIPVRNDNDGVLRQFIKSLQDASKQKE